jgi:heat shock protein HslJ
MVGDDRRSGGYVDGTVGARAHALRFSRVASTRMACPDPDVMAQEAYFLQAMEQVTDLQVEGNRLDLLKEDGSMAIILERAPCGIVMD